jgi:hypothetical protein
MVIPGAEVLVSIGTSPWLFTILLNEIARFEQDLYIIVDPTRWLRCDASTSSIKRQAYPAVEQTGNRIFRSDIPSSILIPNTFSVYSGPSIL